MGWIKRFIPLIPLTLALLASCNKGTGSSVDCELRHLVQTRGILNAPTINRELPKISDPKAQLGMQLFFSKVLSGKLDTACASCHHPVLGGGDGLALSVGVDASDPDILGLGRFHHPGAPHYDGGPTVARNAPTTFNIGLWDQVLFHDGRVESIGKTPGRNGGDQLGIETPDSVYAEADRYAGNNLVAAQAQFPMTAFEEMRGYANEGELHPAAYRAQLQQRLGGYGEGGGTLAVNAWLAAFRYAYEQPTANAPELVTFAHIIEAIGEYQRSQVFIDSPWQRWLSGDNNALDEPAKRGAQLFFQDYTAGGAQCYQCHQGNFFTDEQFHVLAVPQVGRGKGDGQYGNHDFGRQRVSGQPRDKYAFRTPSLLNVEVTGPWGHSGAYDSLEGMVRHHLDPKQAVLQFDYDALPDSLQTQHSAENTQAALDQLERNQAQGYSPLDSVQLSDDQVSDLLAFLKSLTDPCVKDRACLQDWIPDPSTLVRDPLLLIARDHQGNLL